VKDRVPSSALKRHHNAAIRLTSASAWALLKYRERGVVNSDMLRRLDASLSGAQARGIGQFVDVIRAVLTEMEIAVVG